MIPHFEARKEHQLKSNIDFLLSHLDQDVLFPRKVMTKKLGFQIAVNSKEKLMQECLSSDLVDCRINAYPVQVGPNGLTNQPPNFIFIDLDLSTFQKYKNPKSMLDKTLQNTLYKISDSFSLMRSQHTQHTPLSQHINMSNEKQPIVVKPTVLWSGNGYHIYLPIQAVVLEHFEPFTKEKFPNLFLNYGFKYSDYTVSELFLLFAKQYLTEGKADPQHRPKYKTCLIRIPNTFNSKCLNKGLSPEESKIKIIQKWNGYRPPIQLLTKDFRRWLIQEEINQKIQIKKFQNVFGHEFGDKSISRIEWIEKLLKVPLVDHRKYCLWRILFPYLRNVRKVSKEESIVVLDNWLEQCSKKKKLDFNKRDYIKKDIKAVGCYFPISMKKLRENNPDLYKLLMSK
jgi:hypothetical protein